MKLYLSLLLTATAVALLFAPSQASAQNAPSLGTAASYAVLGTNVVPTSGTVTCTGPGSINGNVGTTFNGGITNPGPTPCVITGSIVSPVLATVVNDFNAAYASINDVSNPCTGTIPTTTTTLAPGVYCSAAGTTIGAGVIITLDGSASDVWVFRVGTGGLGALTLTDAQVVMANAAQACNVYWKTAEAATLTRSNFVGTILSGAAITMTDGSWLGRGLASTDVTVTRAAPLTFAACDAAAASITVNKDFIPNNVAPVSVALTCTSGTVTTTPLNAAEGAPAVFTVTGGLPGATCTATETVPAGYTANQANCANVALGGNCTITNTLNSATITVNKDFIPNNVAPVPVALTCTSGTVTTTPLNAAEGAPAVFTVTGANLGATCTATETVPAGYTAIQANCVNVALGGSCTITNTLVCPVITVNPTTLPNPVVGTAYDQQISASGGGETSYTFAVTSGALPTNLVLDGATGTITGTPTAAGTFDFTITATDTSTGCFGSQAYRVVIAAADLTGIPTLDSAGLMMMMLLLLGAGMIVIGRFTR